MNIIDYIPQGHINAIPIVKLIKYTGLTGRNIRQVIERERRNTAILNLQDGKGYFKPKLPEEKELLERYIKQETHRAKKTFYNLAGAKKALRG